MEKRRGDGDVVAIGGDDGIRQRALERFLHGAELPNLVDAVLHLGDAVADGAFRMQEHRVERRPVVLQ